MFIGIRNASRMARVGPERHPDALAVPHGRRMDFTGRPLTGYVYVDPPVIAKDGDLKSWLLGCVQHAAGQPGKPARWRITRGGLAGGGGTGRVCMPT